MTILLTGANGMLGSSIQEALKENEVDYISTDIKGNVDCVCNLSLINELDCIINKYNIDKIINCAAWTAVDDAEDEDKKALVYEINVKALENICILSKKYNCKLLHISTDYVFDGRGDKPWKDDDIPNNPINFYGYTKMLGEKIVEKLDKYFIVRIQWTYGKNGKNFVDTMLKAAQTHDEVKVVNDQIGSPTYVKDLAKVLIEMINSDKYGYYHVASSGNYISWYDFCKEIYYQAGKTTKVIPVSSGDYGVSKAKRPNNSRLDRSKYIKSGFSKLPDWKESLNSYLKETNNL